MIANALGGIAVLGEPAALYRRHEAALTGSYAGKTVRERVNKSRAVGGDHYRFLAEVARSSRTYLERVATEVNDDQWRSSFRRSAELFESLTQIQDQRASLYEAEGILSRAAHYLRIWQSGGYVGPRFTAMGARSALKDAARLFVGSRITVEKAR